MPLAVAGDAAFAPSGVLAAGAAERGAEAAIPAAAPVIFPENSGGTKGSKGKEEENSGGLGCAGLGGSTSGEGKSSAEGGGSCCCCS